MDFSSKLWVSNELLANEAKIEKGIFSKADKKIDASRNLDRELSSAKNIRN